MPGAVIKDKVFEVPATETKPSMLFVSGGKGATDTFTLDEVERINNGKATRQQKKRWERFKRATRNQ